MHATKRLRLLLVLAIADVALLAGTALLAFGDAEDEPQRSQSPPPGMQTAQRDGVRARIPDNWAPTDETPRLLGLERAHPIVLAQGGLDVQLLAVLLPAVSRGLLPEALSDASRAPQRDRVRLGPDVEGYRYSGFRHPAVEGIFDVVVAPTTEGVLTVVCVAREWLVALLPQCGAAAIGVSTTRGTPLPLDEDAGFLSRLPEAMRRLNADRARVGRDLRASVDVEGYREAVGRLAGAHARAAAVLDPLVAPDSTLYRRLVRALRLTAEAFDRLRRALEAGDADAVLDAQAVVTLRQRQLQVLLAELTSPPAR